MIVHGNPLGGERIDCGGKLYIQVHGGFLNQAPSGGSSTSDDRPQEVEISLSVGGRTHSALVWGRSLVGPEAERKQQQHQVLKDEDSGTRWWFGNLGSTCLHGSACPNPAECTHCTQHYGPRNSEDANLVDDGATSQGGGRGGGERNGNAANSVLRALKGHSLFKKGPSSKGGKSNNSADPNQLASQSNEQVNATFQMQELVFDVKDYFGRMPISFQVKKQDGLCAGSCPASTGGSNAPGGARSSKGNKNKKGKKTVTAARKSSSPNFSFMAAASVAMGHNHSGAGGLQNQVDEGSLAYGRGRAFLSDALSFDATKSLLAGASSSSSSSSSSRSNEESWGQWSSCEPATERKASQSLDQMATTLVDMQTTLNEPLLDPASMRNDPRAISLRQIIRLVGPTCEENDATTSNNGPSANSKQQQRSRLVGCIVAEMCFIPTKLPDIDCQPLLHDAVARGKVALVSSILEPLRRKPLSERLTRRSPIKSKFCGLNLYETAVYTGQCKVLSVLLDLTTGTSWSLWNANNEQAGRNALHYAVASRNAAALQMVAMHAYKHELSGASIFEAFDGSLDSYGLDRLRSAFARSSAGIGVSMHAQRDLDGRTPFAATCALQPKSASDEDAVALALGLLEFEQDVATTDDQGNTPLLLATATGQTGVAYVLLNLLDEGPPGIFLCRAKPNKPNKAGLRPLHIAASRGDINLVKALLEAGALSSLRAKDGSTALHLAAKGGHTAVVQALLEWPKQYEALLYEHKCIAEQEHQEKHVSAADDSTREGTIARVTSAQENQELPSGPITITSGAAAASAEVLSTSADTREPSVTEAAQLEDAQDSNLSVHSNDINSESEEPAAILGQEGSATELVGEENDMPDGQSSAQNNQAVAIGTKKFASARQRISRPFRRMVNKIRRNKPTPASTQASRDQDLDNGNSAATPENTDGDEAFALALSRQLNESGLDRIAELLGGDFSSPSLPPLPPHPDDELLSQSTLPQSPQHSNAATNKNNFNQGISAAEAVFIRLPQTNSIQWCSGKTALQLAKEGGHDQVVELLMKAYEEYKYSDNDNPTNSGVQSVDNPLLPNESGKTQNTGEHLDDSEDIFEEDYDYTAAIEDDN